MPFPLRLPFALAFTALVAVSNGEAAAAPRCQATVMIEVAGQEPVNESDVTDAGCGIFGQSGPASMSGDGEADYGALRAHSDATFLEGDADTTVSFVRVEWRDDVTVDSPGLTGQIGLVEGAVFLEGFIDLTGSADGTLTVDFSSTRGSSSAKHVQCFGEAPCEGQLLPLFFSESVPIAFGVTFGEPGFFLVSLSTNIGRNSISTAPGTADLDFSGTATWSGIQQVTVGGSPVPFTITSESGTDWTEPVPEPAQAAMLLAGAALLCAVRRSS
jgi:hypothetical protein